MLIYLENKVHVFPKFKPEPPQEMVKFLGGRFERFIKVTYFGNENVIK